MNGDGYQDILTLSNSNTSGAGALSVVRYWDPVQQTFTAAVNRAAFNGWAFKTGQMTLGDVNGDGLPDVVTPTFSTTPVPATYGSILPLTGFEVFLGKLDPVSNRWAGDFEASAYTSVSLKQPNVDWGLSLNLNNQVTGTIDGVAVINTVLGDFNGDGKLDLVIPEADGITIFANPGNGQFSKATGQFVQSAGSSAALNLISGDFNHDGKLDLASSPNYVSVGLVGNTAPSYTEWQASTAPISVYMNNSTVGSTNFALKAVQGFENPGWNGTIALSDFNGDGNLDIAVASASNETTLYGILRGDGTGNFATLTYFTGYSNDADGYDNKFQRSISYISVADFNNDGQPDLATAAANIGPTGSTAATGSKRNSAVGITGISYNRTFLSPGIDGSSIVPLTAGVPVSLQLKPTGGDPSKPYIYSLAPNSVPLPAGLTLSPQGLLSGTPTQSGPFQLTMNVTQPDGPRGSSFANVIVNGAAPGLITPSSIENAVLGVPFNQQFTSSGGPATWVVSHGALPAGLTLSPTGQLSGTPTSTGQYNFQLTATGGNTQTSLSYVMVVQAPSTTTAAPTVTRIARYGYHNQRTILVVSFSQAMDSVSASNVKNYVLVSAGADGIFGTRDDQNIALASSVYNTGSQSVTLNSVQRNYPFRRHYTLTVNGTPSSGLKSDTGTFLGGMGSGAAGTNYVKTFGPEVLAGPNNAARTLAIAKHSHKK